MSEAEGADQTANSAALDTVASTLLVNRLVRLRVPRALAAALLLSGLVGGVGTLAWSLSDDAASVVEALSEVAQKLRRVIASHRDQGPAGTIDKVQKAASELARVAEDSTTALPPHPHAA